MQKINTPHPPAPTAGDTTDNCTAGQWIRPPLTGQRCPHTGLTRASFYRELIACSRIRQAKMGTGRDRGTRLLWLPDVHREIHRRAAAQAAK